MKHQQVVLNIKVNEMPKLIYNKELNMYEVWTDAVEGAQRQKEATATEEWVIQTILQQDKIIKTMKQFDARLALLRNTITNDVRDEIEPKLEKILDNIDILWIEIRDKFNQLNKKKWWHFWK